MTKKAEDKKEQPSVQLITQYIKDMSFENPNAPESLLSGWPAPETTVQISLGHRQLGKSLFESGIKFRIEARNKKDNKMAFIIDMHYAAAVALNNVPDESILPVLMVEVPKLLFPFAREIVANATTKGGYPPLYLAPISFEELYMAEMKRLKAEHDKKDKK